MIRFLRHAAALIPLFAAGLALGAGNISGSAHDFSQGDSVLFQASGGEICKPCHTPHNAVDATLSDRLWAHELSEASYTVHAGRVGGALDEGKSAAQTDMDAQSRLCLSCHDGTVALDAFAGAMTTGTHWAADSTRNLGTNLLNDHPVGGHTKYDTSVPGRYKDMVSEGKVAILGGTGTLPLVKSVVTPSEWSLSCTTCHNAHGAGFNSLLRGDNQQSNLCLSCHNK